MNISQESMHKEPETEEINSSAETPVREGYKQTKLGWIPEEWEVKKLEEIGKVVSGLTYSPKDVADQGILVLRSSNIQNDKLTFEDNVYVNTSNLKFNKVEENDILICVRNGSKNLIGKNASLNKTVAGSAFGAFMMIYRSKFNYFVKHYFKTSFYQKEIHKNLGATINSINSSNLKKFKIPFPPLPEQQKIAQILSTWDKAIALQEQLLAEKQALKKGLMQELLTGRKRFPGFDEEWEELKLGDKCKILMCKRIFASQTSENEEIPFYKIGTIGKIADAFISRKLFEEYKKKYNYPRKGEILITCSGTVGNCILFNGEDAYFQDSNIVWLDNKNNDLDNKFLYYLISNIDWSKLNSTTITRIYTSDLKKLNLKMPIKKEQQKIAATLSNCDIEIENLIIYKDSLIQQKKGLMEQLLTGKKRVTEKNRSYGS